jgi:exodeoxyribonuclease V alpha subunit
MSGDTPPQTKSPVVLEGTVEKIVYSNPETLYTIAILKVPELRRELTIVGSLANIQPQEVLRATGEFIIDRKYGQQFRVDEYTRSVPATAVGLEKFLGSGLIKGIGKTYAKKLVAEFGMDLISIIENEPRRLLKIGSIGPKRVEQIQHGWHEHRTVRDILMFLQQYGIPQGFAARIFKEYGEKAIDKIRSNPYQLALDIHGIGFKSADAIAQKLGIPTESLERAKAGVIYVLQEFAAEGHTFYPADPLIEKSVEVLQVAVEIVANAINHLKSENHIVLEVLPDGSRAVYLRHLHTNETSAAEWLVRLLKTGKLLPEINADREIAEFEQKHHFEFAEKQKLAVRTALRGGVVVITGGPGTGKTTITRAILRILTKYGVSVTQAAPTGRAAKRMQELTRADASTIHRLLQFSPQEGGYVRNARNPIKTDFLIIDESSMIDISLANALLRAILATSSVIFVGDTDQLPSVGPGNFLLDLITSGVLPVIHLDQIFRQAQQSLIVTNAHRINAGEFPVLNEPGEGKTRDFYFIRADEPEQVVEQIRQLVTTRIPAKFNLNPIEDIQVITPMHRGVAGAQNINAQLQQLLNPSGASVERAGVLFRVGDKVMQTSNDYDKDIFNGDIGIIAAIDREDHLLKVSFDGRIVAYDFTELYELELAYAITVHKSQGSEYRAVIMPVHTTHFIMLQRNLLYTGITRGKKLVCLVGTAKAVALAVKNANQASRYSALQQRLASLYGSQK